MIASSRSSRPALGREWPSTRTWPAMMAACAFARVGKWPRSTSSRSSRFLVGLTLEGLRLEAVLTLFDQDFDLLFHALEPQAELLREHRALLEELDRLLKAFLARLELGDDAFQTLERLLERLGLGRRLPNLCVHLEPPR